MSMSKIIEHTQLHRCDLGEAWLNAPMQWSDFYAWIVNSTPNSEALILDAGAGEGKAKELFKQKNVTYIGVDSCVGSDHWNYGQVIKRDLNNLDFIETGTVNVVLLMQVLEHLEEPDSVIKEISRVMATGAKAFVSVPQTQGVHQVPFDYLRYTPYGIRALFERHGLKLKQISPQLCGDLVAGSSFLLWALKSADEDVKNPFNKLVVKIFIFLAKIGKRFLKYPDGEVKRHRNPIGYFACLEKQ